MASLLPRIVWLPLVIFVACTSPDVPETVLSPAPTDCPMGIIRADTLAASELVDAMHGHVPTRLPPGFGLQEAYTEGEGFQAAARWAAADCRRSVFLALWRGHDVPEGAGAKVGAWSVTADSEDILVYHANTDEGLLGIQMSGLTRAQGDDIVASIPT